MQTKKEFTKYFRTEIESEISSTDKPALRQAWNDTIDFMTRDNQLPATAKNWGHPVRFYHPTERKRKLKPGTKRLKKGDSVTVIGRRWFDRGPGNTYHSVQVLVNGEIVYQNPFEYGYESAYIQTAMKWLAANYKMPKKFDEQSPMWRLRDHGILVVTSVADVNRKKDL